MNLLWLFIIGGGAAAISRHFMRRRCYGPFDDLLWGILGAVLGDSLTASLGLATSGSVTFLLMPCAGAASLLLITGCIKGDSSCLSSDRPGRSLTRSDEDPSRQVLAVSDRGHSRPLKEKSFVPSESGVQGRDLRRALHLTGEGREKRSPKI